MKDNLEYFSHDADAMEHPKHQALIAVYGFEGYGRFWALNESISKSSGGMLDLSKKRNKATIANKLQMKLSEFDEFIDFLADDEECGLLKIQDGIVWTDRTQEDLERVMRTRKDSAKRRSPTIQKNNTTVDQQFSNESKTLSNESKKTTNKNHRAEQSRAEQTRLEQSRADNELVDNSEPSMDPKDVRAAAAVLNLQLKSGEAATAAQNLADNRVDTEFIRWASGEIKSRSAIKSPAGFLKRMLLALSDYGDWVSQYRDAAARASPSVPSIPKPGITVCPICGESEHLWQREGELWCSGCKKLLLEYDSEFEVWSEPAETRSAG